MTWHARASLVAVGFALLTARLPQAAARPDARMRDASAYRVGDTWGKNPVLKEDLAAEGEVFAQAALAVAAYGNATSFYLGHFAGHHVMATNHHVQSDLDCRNRQAVFPLANARFACQKVFAAWPEVDVALFAIDVPADARPYFAGLGHNFAFTAHIYPGQPLLTLGFGVAENPYRQLTASRDDDCKVFSGRDAFRLMRDPDKFNPGPHATWSFAHGCDISHGDSGSPLFDRRDGAVLGLMWTGAIPKTARAQSSARLQRLLDEQDPAIWEELSYGVPAAHIGQRIIQALETEELDADRRQVLQAVVGTWRDAQP